MNLAPHHRAACLGIIADRPPANTVAHILMIRQGVALYRALQAIGILSVPDYARALTTFFDALDAQEPNA